MKPNAAIAADVVLLDHADCSVGLGVKVLLVRRGNNPFKGMWALPGGFVNDDEETGDAAARELMEETGICLSHDDRLSEIFTVADVNRDPRGRVVTIVHYAWVDSHQYTLRAGDDAVDVAWFRVDELTELAADHLKIIERTIGETYNDTL